MKNKIIAITLLCLLLAAMLFLTSCGESTPYDQNDEDGFNVTVKYDAGVGTFTTNVSVITDSYNISQLTKDANGKVQLKLIDPADPVRGSANAYSATNSGYFLAGWYTERTEQKDSDGKVTYSYSGRWDFEKDRLAIDPDDTHTAKEPITLYAAWIRQFSFDFYSVKTGELIDSHTIDPNYVTEIAVPVWDEETGKLSYGSFPELKDMTLDGVYLDQAMTSKVESASLKHTGVFNAANATAENPVMKVYLDYKEGEWFRIYNADQFIKNASVGGCYEILADLDFEGKIWKTNLIHGNFRGKIEGNGHTFKNITVEQTDARKQYTGLFGTLTAEAVLRDISFENVTVTIASGTIQQDTAFGLVAGSIDNSATVSGITVKDSTLAISSSANLPDDASIGLFCGIGSAEGIDLSGISAVAVGDNPEGITVKVNGNEVTVTVK